MGKSFGRGSFSLPSMNGNIVNTIKTAGSKAMNDVKASMLTNSKTIEAERYRTLSDTENRIQETKQDIEVAAAKATNGNISDKWASVIKTP